MEASELRIGNVVSTLRAIGNYWSWTFISHEDIYSISCGNENNFKPTPLTEEWLLKFGFKKDFNGYYFGLLSFSITRNNEFMICVNDRPTETICYSVHQLQNLYFALTGEELKQQEQ
jgi:hypothetical protein